MPRITEQRQEATRQRILQGARRVFVEKGFHEATIDDLVAECGLSVGAIYGYFKGKDELIRASILAANRQESDAVLEDTQAAGTVREKMERAIRGWWAYTIETPGGPAFLAEAWAAASRRPLIRDLLARRRERIVTVVSIICREGIAGGDLDPDLDVDEISRTFAALLDGLVLERIDAGDTLRLVDAQLRALVLLSAAARVSAEVAGPDAG